MREKAAQLRRRHGLVQQRYVTVTNARKLDLAAFARHENGRGRRPEDLTQLRNRRKTVGAITEAIVDEHRLGRDAAGVAADRARGVGGGNDLATPLPQQARGGVPHVGFIVDDENPPPGEPGRGRRGQLGRGRCLALAGRDHDAKHRAAAHA